MIDDGIDNASAIRMAEASKGADMPVREPRPASEPEKHPDVPKIGPSLDMPRDIAREPPRDVGRDAPSPPIRDIARDAPQKDVPRPRDKPRDRDQQRDQLQDLLREVQAARETPLGAPAPAADKPKITPPPDPATAAPGVVTVRSPGLSLLAILILILGIVGAGLLGWQLNLLQGQMDELRNTVAQNGKVAESVNRLSDAAMQANEIANQSLTSATRPWVGIDAVEAGSIQAGRPLNIEVRVRNSGRTPSTDVQGLFLVYISPIDNPPALLAEQCASCVKSVVLPNGVVSYKLSVRDNVMTADEAQRIRDGKDTMWIVGRLDYHDAEGEAHTTRSCLYYRSSGISAFTACGDGNSAN